MRIHHHHHPHFLVYVNSAYLVGHGFLPTWNRRNARAKTYTPSRATTLPAGTDGATQIGSKRAFRTKLFHGLASSSVATIFAVPRPLIVHVPTRFDFHFDGWAAGSCETLTSVGPLSEGFERSVASPLQ